MMLVSDMVLLWDAAFRQHLEVPQLKPPGDSKGNFFHGTVDPFCILMVMYSMDICMLMVMIGDVW